MIIATSRKPSLQRSPAMRVGSYARTQACSTNYRLNLFRGGKIVPHLDLLEVSPWQAKGKSQNLWVKAAPLQIGGVQRAPSAPAITSGCSRHHRADACPTGGGRAST